MRRWLILPIALISTTASAVTVWKWVDKSGEPHYTDHPVPGATRIELADAPTVPAFHAPTPSGASEAAPQKTPAYRRFVIAHPAEQQTLWNIGGKLAVQLDIEPPLAAGSHFDVLLDGKRLSIGAASPSFTVPKVYRGTHTLQALIVDSEGKIVLRSLPVTFQVQQTSVLNPNNKTPPAVRGRATGG